MLGLGVRRGCRCCPSMSRPRLRCRCCFHVPKLASCQLELLRRRHARNQLDQATPLSLPFPFTHQVSNKYTTLLRYIFFSNYIPGKYFLYLPQRPTRTHLPIHFRCVSTNTCISSLTEKKSLNLFTSYNMYTKGLVNSRRRKIRARDARTTLFSSSQVLHTGQRRNLRRQKQKQKKKKKKETPKCRFCTMDGE